MSDGNQRLTFPLKCAWCGRIQLGSHWVPDRRGVVERYSHGICGPCSATVFHEAPDPED